MTCQLKAASKTTITAACGKEFRAAKKPLQTGAVSAWHDDVDCTGCIDARYTPETP